MANACNSVIVMNGHSNMNLKLWLTLKLDCSNFQEHGIEYISKEVGTFKIIWVKQSEPGWKILEQLLKEWALNKDGKEKKYKFSELKSRFRDALRNSNYIDLFGEVQHLQTGNYKLYRFLTSEETEAKKEKEKLKKKTSNDVSERSSVPEELSMDLSDLLNISDTSSEASQIQFSPSHNHFNNQIAATDHSDTDLIANAMNEVGIQPNCGLHHDMDMEVCVNPNEVQPPDAATTSKCNGPAAIPMFNSLQELLENTFTAEEMLRLSEFEVTLRYEQNLMFTKTIDFANGRVFRLQDQPSAFAGLNFFEEFFPNYDFQKACKNKILNGLQKGFVLQASPEADLMIVRRSKMRMFYYSSENNNQAVQIDRNTQSCIFSFLNYLENVLNYRAGVMKNRPDSEILMVFGVVPTSPKSVAPISLTLKPVLADTLNQRLGYSENNLSLLFSDEESISSLKDTFRNISNSVTEFLIGC